MVRAGLLGGLVGGVTIWIYEATVWVGAQHLMPLGGIPANATALVFGKGPRSPRAVFVYPRHGDSLFLLFRMRRAVRLYLALLPPAWIRGDPCWFVLCGGDLDRHACCHCNRFIESSKLP